MTAKITIIEHKINFLLTVNLFLLIDENVVIVDTGVENSYKLVVKKLEELNIEKNRVSLILITHSHPDHCLGAVNMKKYFNVPLAVSKAESPYLEKGDFSPVVPQNILGAIVYRLLKKLHEKHDKKIIPDIVFEKELDLTEFGVSGKAIVTPGHSVGGCSVIFPDGNCIAGDLLIEDLFTKKPRPNLFATDFELLKKSLQSLLKQSKKNIYTSHGKSWRSDYVEAQMDKLLF